MGKKQVELLAPAGTEEAFRAAVGSGADAVYLGGTIFSARQGAGNFTKDQMERVHAYARHVGVSIYVTVNTLVKDKEMPELLEWLHFLDRIGIEGVIVQDLGVLHILKNHFPRLEIHASTQMTVNNRDGIHYLQRQGVRRIILARETSMEEIRLMAREDVELEVFVHGALCLCYSGQCFMSSMIGGRSGNRGRCVQPCRMPYSLVDREGRELSRNRGDYLLSPRDLKTIRFLEDIIEAGVSCLKIEGRIKRPEYVATVVRNYRQKLDALMGTGKPLPDPEEQDRQLAQIFNREFTSGYFYPVPEKDRMSEKRPNNRGVFLGRINDSTANGFVLEIRGPLFTGDELDIWVSKGGRKALTVDRMTVQGEKVGQAGPGQSVEIYFNGRVFPGDRVFKTCDAPLMEEARNNCENSQLEGFVDVNVRLSGEPGLPLKMEMTDEKGNRAVQYSDKLLQKARNRPLTEETAREKMRFGGTSYRLANLSFEVEPGSMLPLSSLNSLRRQTAEELDRKRGEKESSEIKVSLPPVEKRKNPGKLLLSVEVDGENDARIALDKGADRVYVHLSRWQQSGCRGKRQLLHREPGQQLFYVIPRIIRERDREKIREKLEEVISLADGILAGSLGALETARSLAGNDCLLAGDWTLNAMNTRTLVGLREEGLDSVCISPELSFEEIGQLGDNVSLEALVHGNMPLMVSEYCMAASILCKDGDRQSCGGACRNRELFLEDRFRYRFPLFFDCDCHMHLYNSRELCLAEDLERFPENGVKWVRLMLRERDRGDIGKIVEIYRSLLDRPGKTGEEAGNAREKLSRLSPYGFTKGHYYRGVK